MAQKEGKTKLVVWCTLCGWKSPEIPVPDPDSVWQFQAARRLILAAWWLHKWFGAKHTNKIWEIS